MKKITFAFILCLCLLGVCAQAEAAPAPDQEYIFKDAKVKAAVCEILERHESRKVTYGDLLKITSLLVLDDVTTLEDFAVMTNLETLLVMGPPDIVDYSPTEQSGEHEEDANHHSQWTQRPFLP